MTAIVRQTFGRHLAKLFLGDNDCYIGIGKSDTFSVTDAVVSPSNNIREEREFRNNLQSIKKVEGSTFVVPRVNWSSGTLYSGWLDSVRPDDGHAQYVMTGLNHVYVCISEARSSVGEHIPSFIEPRFGIEEGVDLLDTFTTADGYTWKFLFALSTTRINQFLSSNYIPVEHIETTPSDAFQQQQLDVQNGSIGGQVISAIVESAGSGYTVAPSVTVVGNGTGATAVATINTGGLRKITMTNYGQGYDYASFIIEGNAKARAIVTSSEGLGANPINDLKTSSMLFTIKPNGTENGTFVVENSFRQIGLLENLTLVGSTDVYNGVSAKVLNTITLDVDGGFSAGNKITGDVTGAVAFIDDVQDNIIHYHQNESTGFVKFINSETVSEIGGTGSGIISSTVSLHTVDRYSGEVLYIENRARIIRDQEQQEDIKIVITV